MPYDIERARLIKENARLKRQLDEARRMLPEGAGWCEECERGNCECCGYAHTVTTLENRLMHAQSSLRHERMQADEYRYEAEEQLEKCQLKNKKLMSGARGF